MGFLRDVFMGPAASSSTELERSGNPLSFDEFLSYFTFNSNQYQLGLNQTMPGAKTEMPSADFAGLSRAGFKGNGVVFTCMLVRMLLFSQTRFQFRDLDSGQPGDLFGTQALGILEKPWANGTTGDLLARAIQDADLAGNHFGARRPGNKIFRMRPDWVTIVLGSMDDPDSVAWDVDAEVLGYVYQPGGPGSGRDPVVFSRDEVYHFAPIPDPEAQYRGMSWLTPVIREITGDSATSDHKISFFENGATPNLVVKLDASVRQDAFDAWVAKFKHGHEGTQNAYKTLFLGGGADATAVGANFQQMDFRSVQGAGETRIASAARVPPVIAGFSEGLQGSSLNQGNYQMARRMFVDMTMHPLWDNFAGSVASIIDVPKGAELVPDDRGIPALREDAKDAAEIQQMDATAIRTLVDGGFDPAAVITAITTGDLTVLKTKHTGLLPVQLQPPGSNGPAPADVAAGKALAVARSEGERADMREIIGTLARNVNPTPITVEGPNITVEAAPAPNVTVEAPPATMITVEAAAAPNVTVAAADPPTVTVEAPSVTVESPSVTVEAPSVTVEAAAAPNVTVDVAAPNVDVHVPAAKPGKKTVTFSDGRAATIEEEPADG